MADLKALRTSELLIRKQRILSPNDKVVLQLQEDGDLTVTLLPTAPSTTPIILYSTGPTKGATQLIVTPKGELKKLSKEGVGLWSSDPFVAKREDGKDTVLVVQDDGHAVVLWNAARWWRSPCRKVAALLRGQLGVQEWLAVGDSISSPNQKASLVIQSGDGKLNVLVDGKPVWPVEGSIVGVDRLYLRSDDNLVALDKADKIIWSTLTRRRKAGGNATLSIDNSGTLTLTGEALGLAGGDGMVLWSTKKETVHKDAWIPVDVVSVPPDRDRLLPGEYIQSSKRQLISPNGEFILDVRPGSRSFFLQRKAKDKQIDTIWDTDLKSVGNLIGIPAERQVFLCLSWSGELLLYDETKLLLGRNETAGNASDAALVLKNNGLLELQGRTWSGGAEFPASIAKVDRLKWGQRMGVDQQLISPNGQNSLTLLPTCNLLVQGANTYHCYNDDNPRANRDKTNWARYIAVRGQAANVCILSGKGGSRWSTSNTEARDATKECALALQDDGNIVFTMNGKKVWESYQWPRGTSVEPRDRMPGPSAMSAGGMLVSLNAEFWMTLEASGDILVRSKKTYGKPPLFNSKTTSLFPAGAKVQLELERDQCLQLVDVTKDPSPTKATIKWRRPDLPVDPSDPNRAINRSLLMIRTDGKLVVTRATKEYDKNTFKEVFVPGEEMWDSETEVKDLARAKRGPEVVKKEDEDDEFLKDRGWRGGGPGYRDFSKE